MTLGSHLTPLSRSYIEEADVVFAATSDGIVELWLAKMNPRRAQPAVVLSRRKIARRQLSARWSRRCSLKCAPASASAALSTVIPGVFAGVPHDAIELARREGYDAHMEPGVSAEDCLYADLGIDPGRYGCQHFEASQLMLYRRRIDPSAYLVLWQVGVAGDRSLTRFATGAEYRQVLVDVLMRDYEPGHEAIVYKVATLPTQQPRIERTTIAQLPAIDIDMHATVVIPPAARAAARRAECRERLAALDRTHVEFTTPRGCSLRSMRESDEQLYCELFCDPETMRHIGSAVDARRSRARVSRRARSDAGHAAARAVPDADPEGHAAADRSVHAAELRSARGGRPSWASCSLSSGRAQGFATDALIAVIGARLRRAARRRSVGAVRTSTTSPASASRSASGWSVMRRFRRRTRRRTCGAGRPIAAPGGPQRCVRQA